MRDYSLEELEEAIKENRRLVVQTCWDTKGRFTPALAYRTIQEVLKREKARMEAEDGREEI